MQKFKVTGIDTRTNEVVGLDVEADSVVEARRIAGDCGLRHVAITHQPLATEAQATHKHEDAASEAHSPQV